MDFSFVYATRIFQLLQRYDQHILSWLVFWIQIIRSDELVISSIVISSYYGKSVLNPKSKKTNESHTKHSNYIKRSIEFLFNLIELRAYLFVKRKKWKRQEKVSYFIFFFIGSILFIVALFLPQYRRVLIQLVFMFFFFFLYINTLHYIYSLFTAQNRPFF